jgi:hypothetical protein
MEPDYTAPKRPTRYQRMQDIYFYLAQDMTIADIALNMGYSRGTIYTYFGMLKSHIYAATGKRIYTHEELVQHAKTHGMVFGTTHKEK